MTIPVICSNGHKLNVPEKYLGSSIRCPKCQAVVLVEAPVELQSEESADDSLVDLSSFGGPADPLGDPLSNSYSDPLGNPSDALLDPNLGALSAPLTYQPSAIRPAAKHIPKPHFFETMAGKASTVGGGVALGSVLALMLLGFISLFRGGSLVEGTSLADKAPQDPNAPDPLRADVRETVTKMRTIMLAMFNFQDKTRRFPGGSSKVSHLSWRVHLLPFLGQDELFKKFKMDEPWDSPTNQELGKEMPDVFRIGNAAGTKTRFQVIRGENMLFGKDKAPGFNAFTDGLEKTLLIVATGDDKATHWTQPDDFEFDPENSVASLGKVAGNVIVMTVGDKVMGVGSQIDPKDFLAMVTPSGGEVVDPVGLMESTLSMTPAEFSAGIARTVANANSKVSGADSGVKIASASHELVDQVQVSAYSLHAHNAIFKSYAPSVADRPGGGLSWRVHILPFVGEKSLYSEFKMDEPWDGPNNLKLLKRIPQCFNTRNGTKTRIVGNPDLLGPSGARRDYGMSDSPESTLLTLAVPEAMAIEWTKPDDWVVSDQTIGDIIAQSKNQPLFGVTCFGQPLKFDDAAKTHLKSLLSINGGEKIELPKMMNSAQMHVPINDDLTKQVNAIILESKERGDRLKKIVLAMQNYESAFGGLPPAKPHLSPEGKPRLSWRVLILPFLDEANLQAKFKLDEPWDSPNNKALLNQMPSVFKEPGSSEKSKTNLIKVAGPHTIYNQTAGPALSRITDGGLSVLLYETSSEQPVPWTKPDDFEIDLANVKAAVGKHAKGYFYCAMADGRVIAIKTAMPAEQLKALFSADGRELLPQWMNDYSGIW